jgi:hypothetical protein
MREVPASAGGSGRAGVRDAALALAVAAVALAAQWPFRLLSVNVIDEGLVMQLGADLLAGKHLYADAVVFAWPGTFYLAAAAFWLWATSVEVARALVAGSFAVTVALAFACAARFSRRRSSSPTASGPTRTGRC